MALSKQEVFNKVALHLLKQFTKSVELETSNSCMYRGHKGNKCAVGALIPDEMYREEMEWHTSGQLLACFPQLQSLFKDDELFIIMDMLTFCQWIHDEFAPDQWYDQILKLAEKFDLNLDVIRQRDVF